MKVASNARSDMLVIEPAIMPARIAQKRKSDITSLVFPRSAARFIASEGQYSCGLTDCLKTFGTDNR